MMYIRFARHAQGCYVLRESNLPYGKKCNELNGLSLMSGRQSSDCDQDFTNNFKIIREATCVYIP